MSEIQDLLFGLKPDEPVPDAMKGAVKQIRDLERLADFIETENLDVSPPVPGQCQKVRADQVENSAGGFVFSIDDLSRIRRFLILGTTGGTYYSSEKEITLENVKDLCEIIQKGKGLLLLKEILDVSLSGRAPKQNATIFALALCARYKVCDTRNKNVPEQLKELEKRNFVGCNYEQQAPAQAYLDYQQGLQLAALCAVPKVCRIPTHLFMFVKYCKQISSRTGLKENSSGWGRSYRETISNWYFNIVPERLAVHVTKYQSREGYSHRDLFRLCHITPKLSFPEDHKYWAQYAEYDFLFNYIVRGFGDSKKRKADEKLAEASGDNVQKKPKISKKVTEGADAKMEVDVAGQKNVDECGIFKEQISKIFKEKWDEGLDPKVREAVKHKINAFIDDTANDIVFSEKMKALKLQAKKGKEDDLKLWVEKKSALPQSDLESTKTHSYIKAFETLKTMKDATDAVKMIKEYGFVREHVPTDLLNSVEVWAALLEGMPMTAMIRNLGKMASIGLLSSGDKNKVHVDRVVSMLTDEKAIKDARIHPVGVLLAASVYKAGRGIKGSLQWEPIAQIREALDKAFLLAFKNVIPTNKRYCLALDVSGSMGATISGTHLSCKEASCALSTVLLRTEPEVETVAFTSELLELNFDKSTSLDHIMERTGDLSFGNTDCAQPMLWAASKKKKFDVFVIYTDNETWFGEVHPFEALKQYRREMEIPDARLVVMGMTATSFSIADPEDAGMLDICGFDSAVPELLRDFVTGKI